MTLKGVNNSGRYPSRSIFVPEWAMVRPNIEVDGGGGGGGCELCRRKGGRKAECIRKTLCDSIVTSHS